MTGRKTQQQIDKREMVLVDETETAVTCTLWQDKVRTRKGEGNYQVFTTPKTRISLFENPKKPHVLKKPHKNSNK